eukprot:1140754-Pelagomonas_calceolata.AAC.6
MREGWKRGHYPCAAYSADQPGATHASSGPTGSCNDLRPMLVFASCAGLPGSQLKQLPFVPTGMDSWEEIALWPACSRQQKAWRRKNPK